MTSPQKPATLTRRPGGANVVKLAVHKNTKAKRRSQDLRDALIQSAKDNHSRAYLSGYVVVFVDEEGRLNIEIERGAFPPHLMLPRVAEALQAYATQEAMADPEEDENDQQS